MTTNWPVIIEWPDRLPFEVVTPAGCKCITNLATGRRQVTYKTAGQLRAAIERIKGTENATRTNSNSTRFIR